MRSVAGFLALAFGFSWTVAAIAAGTGLMSTPGGPVLIGFPYMLGPAVAAIVCTRGIPWAERRALLGLKVKVDRWLLVAWLLPILTLGLATLGAALMPGTHLVLPADALITKITQAAGPEEAAKLAAVSRGLLSAGLVGQALILGALINLPFMLSEELGWRGYLWSRWQGLGFWRQALATGAVWGVWHAPMILLGHNYPDARVAGVGLMTLFCVLHAPLLHLVRERGGTIWHACLFHGTINAGASLAELCIVSEGWWGRGILGVPGFVVLALTVAAIAVWRKDRPISGEPSPSGPERAAPSASR
jgi:hypothetical protein